jgi:DNA gyrase subunit A
MAKTYRSEDLEFPLQKIEIRDMEKEVKTSFIEYSMSVITSRALPDVRDGMKPGQRRILYAMYEDNLTYDKPFRKSATTVGNVLGRYHPHGDAAVYQAMVRMAQNFSYRYPLVEGHGNFGNVDGDGAAAYRYTEARMSKVAGLMMSDIEKRVVPMTRNFDNTRDEPTVLPSRFPNLLVNGSVGIAVGMATNIPPHNLCEVIDGTVYRIDNPDCSVDELMEYIKGPDFPTAAIIYGSKGIKDAYTTGRGRVYVRARAEIEEENKRIIFTEIPYMVNKAQLMESIGNLYREKKIEGITGIRDESGRAGMRIVVEYRRDANSEYILNQLYKYTQFQETCSINMLVIVNGEPKTLSLPAILDHYINFQKSVIEKRTRYDLDKAEKEKHILEGYRIATDNIDEVIEIIKKSDSIPAAKENLISRFAFSEEQAKAIVEMTLGKLSGLERQKVEDRIAKLTGIIAELTSILESDEKIREILKNELLETKERFGDKRRSELIEATEEIDLEDLIERHTAVVTVTHTGYIKRQKADVYSAQNRGGKGIIGMTTKEDDFVRDVIVANSHSNLLFFTNLGRVYCKKTYHIPEASRQAKGTNLVNIIQLMDNEKVTAIIPITEFKDGEFLTMVTKRGVIKRTLLSQFEYQRKGGKIAITLDDDDELIFVRHTSGNESLIIATKNGYAVRFDENNVRAMGRTAHGVKGITLTGDDFVCGVAVVDDTKTLLTITENGIGKRTLFEDFREMKHRGGKGVTCQNISDKTGKLSTIITVNDDDDIMLITNEGTIIRTSVSGINLYSRTATGVIIMRLADGAYINNVARLEKSEEIEKASEDAEKELKEEIKNMPEVKTEEIEKAPLGEEESF